MPMAANSAKQTMAGAASAAPSAALRNGAVHGVATTTANSPVKKLPAWPERAARLWPAPVAVTPTS